VSPSRDSWIGAGSGMSYMGYNSVATRSYIRIELYINSGEKEYNKELFDFLYSKKGDIEAQFGKSLIWERLDDKVTARVKFELNDVSIFKEDDWDRMISFMVEVVPKFEAAFKKPIYELGRR
jgi:hypothetical protein